MKSKEGRLRIVLTSKPDEFQDEQETGILEFSSFSTKDLVKELEARGYTEALLVGGEEVNGDFLKNDMIDELWLTLEPNIFGSGKGLFKGEFDKELELFEMNRMNERGTILLKYKVL
jgi:dihydrofolate reductase